MSELTDKINALEEIPDNWAKQIMQFQPSMLNRLNRLAAQLTLTSDGFVEMTADNLRRIESILSDLKAYLTTGEYVSIVSELNTQFIAQEANTIAYFQSTFGEAPVTSFASTLYNTRRLQMLETVIGNGLDPMLYTPLRNALLDGVASGSSYQDLMDNISRIAIGDEKLEGVLLRYSRQLVSDTLATTDRQFTQIIGDELGLQWYRYVGGKMASTRCFCLNRNGGYFHRKEIEGWGEMIGIGDCRTNNGWQGMFRGTNPETIFAWVGGYNCQHTLLPISEFDVPKEDIVKAYENGWYNPGSTARAHFGI